MEDPVVASDGHSYDRTYIEAWLQNSNMSPKTGGTIDKRLIPNYAMRSQIETWIEVHAYVR